MGTHPFAEPRKRRRAHQFIEIALRRCVSSQAQERSQCSCVERFGVRENLSGSRVKCIRAVDAAQKPSGTCLRCIKRFPLEQDFACPLSADYRSKVTRS